VPTLLRMPETAANSTDAVLADWVLDEGASFGPDDVIATVETDKAVVDVAAESAGVLVKLLVSAGTSVEVGAAVALLAGVDETVEDLDAALAALGVGNAEGGPTEATPATGAAAPAPASTPEPLQRNGVETTRLFISPLARKIAREAGLDPTGITGTGPNGRIRRRDVDAALAARPAVEATRSQAQEPDPAAPAAAADAGTTAYVEVPHSRMRRTIARRLTESKSTVPHFYVDGTARVDRLLALRAELNSDAGAPKVSVNDLVLKAVAHALLAVPGMNATWGEDAVRRHSVADIAVAVSTDDGLVTPVLRGVERLSVGAVGEAVRGAAERARAGRLRQDELEGGSFTVSNLGMYGTTKFTGIINPPHAGLLAVGAAVREPVVDDDGSLTAATVLRLTLSADHRTVDGVVGAQFMAALVAALESPVTLLR